MILNIISYAYWPFIHLLLQSLLFMFLNGLFVLLLLNCRSSLNGLNRNPLWQGSPTPALLGTGPHSRRWTAGKPVKLRLPLPITRITAWTIPPSPSVCGKIVFHETGPWRQKVGHCCLWDIFIVGRDSLPWAPDIPVYSFWLCQHARPDHSLSRSFLRTAFTVKQL